MSWLKWNQDRSWCLTDLIKGPDGKLSMQMVQTCLFHGSLFFTVIFITIKEMTFNENMWTLYGMAAIGHHMLSKTGNQVTEFKTKKLEVGAGIPPPGPTTTREESSASKTVTQG